MFPTDKERVSQKIRVLFFWIGQFLFVVGSLIAILYQDFGYVKDASIFKLSLLISFFGIIFIFVGVLHFRKRNFYYLFLFIWMIELIIILCSMFVSPDNRIELTNSLSRSVFFGIIILFFNMIINRFFFFMNELEEKKTHQTHKAASGSQTFADKPNVDLISGEFAVDVLSITLQLGIVFGTIAYLLFLPTNEVSSFFSGIDLTSVNLMMAGFVIFFWVAKAVKVKSIELDEKKRDNVRHDQVIAIAQSRDTASLIGEAAKLLGGQTEAEKLAGLSFLNSIAGNPAGFFRKEAFDLMKEFIICDHNTKVANKPRMRALDYVNNLLKDGDAGFDMKERIEIKGESKQSGHADEGDLPNKFDKLSIIYS